MAWFRNMKIGKQIITAFLGLAIITAIVSGSGFFFINKVSNQGTYLYQHVTEPISILSSIRLKCQEIEVSLRDLVTAYSDFDIKAEKANLTNARSELESYTSDLQKNYKSDTKAEKELLKDYINAKNEYLKNIDILVKLAETNDDNEAKMLMKGSLEESSKVTRNAVETMVGSKTTAAEKTSESNDRVAHAAVATMLGLIIINVFVAVAAGVLFNRRLTKSINRLLGVAQKIANDDLDVEVPDMGKDEIGELAKMFAKMAVSLNEFAQHVRTSAEQVEMGSRNVAASSQALSQGATEQASSVEELTVSLEQISAQTSQNAERANEANRISQEAKDNLSKGIDQVKNLISAMDDINESATSVSKIIKTIDDIAFQTNILALNAAVEAAHAGQHGKGFAVVAEEVRNLAARSANAAKETTNLIEHAIKTTEGGTKIAANTANALEKIIEGASKSTDLVGQLAVSSNEQSVGIAQINKAVAQVSDVIQTNSANSEESAAASEELSGQASMLKQLTERIKLKSQKTTAEKEHKDSGESDSSASPKETENKKPKGKARKNKKEEDKPVSIDLSGASYGKYSQ